MPEPSALHLYDIAETDVSMQVVRTECRRPDIYQNGVPVVQLTNGTSHKWIDDTDSPNQEVILRIHIEGNVILLLKGEQ